MSDSTSHRWLYSIAGVPGVTALGLFLIADSSSGSDLPPMTVYKSAACGCCAEWVEHVEDASAVGGGVCQETARIAWREVRRGVTDPARIQRAVDHEWAPADALREQLRRPDGAAHGETP